MAVRSWVPEEEDECLVRLHSEGRSLNSIAKEMGRSAETVSRQSRRLGLSWDRSRTVQATLALVAEAAARRAALEVDLLRDAERLRLQLFAPVTVHKFGGRNNTYASRRLKKPDARAQSDIMHAATTAVAHSLKISKHDPDAGTGAAIGMLDKIAESIELAAQQIGETS